MPEIRPSAHRLDRREFFRLAAGVGAGAALVAAGWPEGYAFAASAGNPGPGTIGTGTLPEQVHLTWGADPATDMTVSWLSPQAQSNAQLVVTPSGGGAPSTYNAATSTVVSKSYTDGVSGETVYAYHVPLAGLTPGGSYDYTVSDAGTTGAGSGAFSSEFTMAETGRFAYTFTSYGDIATPGAGASYTLADGSTVASTTYLESQWNAYSAVTEVENQQPLFHLLNGDLAYADKAVGPPGQTGSAGPVQSAPEVWRDFGLNTQRSAANRPWMACIGNHEAELANGTYGYASYNTRYLFPDNGQGYPGNFYSFQVGSILFISLDANDVAYQGSGEYNTFGTEYQAANGQTITTTSAAYNREYTGTFGPANADGTLPPGANVQTNWLIQTLQNARPAGGTVDWIIVQMHQCAMSSTTDNGCDAGIRQSWLPIFAEYGVDLVLNGHDHDYERSFPVNGFTAPSGTGTWAGGTVAINGSGGTAVVAANTSSQGDYQTFCPQPVGGYTSSSTTFDATLGTIFLTLGGGGTDAPDDVFGSTAQVHTFTQVRTGSKPAADSNEPPIWAAKYDSTDSWGIACFTVDPGQVGGDTTITVNYYDAGEQTNSGTNAPAPAYSATPFDSFTLTRPRADAPSAALPEFKNPAMAAVGAAALAGGALYLQQRRHRHAQPGELPTSSDDAGTV